VPVAASSRGAQRRGNPELDCFPRLAAGVAKTHRRWREALRAFRCADIAKDRFEEASSAKAFGPGRRSFDAQEALEERFAGFVDAADAAMLRLLKTPAPDLDALALKIALIADHLVWELDGGEECLAWLEADARGLPAHG
jgi:hypothetical protein